MNAPKRFKTPDEYNQGLKRLQELRTNPTNATQNEARELAESIEAYRRDNPQGSSQPSGNPDPDTKEG